jgi:hypothetical protein
MENILPILIADAPEALIELCGISLLERFFDNTGNRWG